MVGLCWDVLCSLCSVGDGGCRANGMRVTDSMARPGWNGKSRVFTPTLSYFLRMWGAFEGVFTFVIACAGTT